MHQRPTQPSGAANVTHGGARLIVGVNDLILVASAKYLMDFHDAARSHLHIVTLDNALWRGTKKIVELPNAYDPTQPTDAFNRIFK